MSQSPPNLLTDKRELTQYNQNIENTEIQDVTMCEDVLDKKLLLTPKELAEYWGIGRGTLQQWRLSGTGPIYFKIGKLVKYPRHAIIEYENTRMFRGTAHRVTDGGRNEK